MFIMQTRRLRSDAVRIALPVFVLGVCAVTSASVVKMSLEDLTRKAGLIVTGRVVATGDVHTDEGPRIRTTIAVTERIKGDCSDTLVISQPGGRAGQVEMAVAETVPFDKDEEALLFLWSHSSGEYRVLGSTQGKMTIETGANGDRFVYLPPESGQKTQTKMALSECIQRIRVLTTIEEKG